MVRERRGGEEEKRKRRERKRRMEWEVGERKWSGRRKNGVGGREGRERGRM